MCPPPGWRGLRFIVRERILVLHGFPFRFHFTVSGRCTSNTSLTMLKQDWRVSVPCWGGARDYGNSKIAEPVHIAEEDGGRGSVPWTNVSSAAPPFTAQHAVGREAEAARRQRESRWLVNIRVRLIASVISVNGAGTLSIRIREVANGDSVTLPMTGCRWHPDIGGCPDSLLLLLVVIRLYRVMARQWAG